jgi:preprotein translocase subunit SecE
VQQKNKAMNKVKAYIQEVGEELLRKVTWPTWTELQESAIIVMIATLIFAVVVFAMDFTFNKGMEKLYQVFG